MSWLYLPESVASNSALKRQAVSELCAVLRRITTQPKSSRRVCKKARSRKPRYGTTLPPLTGDLGAALWMSSLAASHVKTSPTQARGWASRRAPVPVYGPKCSASFARYDPATSSWRTCQLSLVEGLDEFSETWPRAGTTRTGIAYQHEALVPLTGGTECSLWPTPQAFKTTPNTVYAGDLVNSQGGALRRGQKPHDKRTGRPVTTVLADAVKLWPTPTSRDHKDGSAQACANVPVNALLGRAVHCPTPEHGGSLTQRTWMSPKTPTGGPAPDHGHDHKLEDQVARTAAGQLNPTWVEWLMGFPLGYTDLDVSATLSYPRWLTTSGSASSRTQGGGQDMADDHDSRHLCGQAQEQSADAGVEA